MTILKVSTHNPSFFLKAKFLDIGGVYYVHLATGIYKGQSKPLDVSMIIVITKVVIAIVAILDIVNVLVVRTILAIIVVRAVFTI